MKSNRLLIISAIIFACLFLISFVVVGLVYLRNLPPSSLSASGYYVRGWKTYYHPGFGLGEPFELAGVDRNSFVILDERYAIDTSHVFYGGYPIPGADPSTFQLLASPFSYDAIHVYSNGTIFSDDPANFEILGENITRDSQHAYWSGTIISNDPSHIVVLETQNYHTYLYDSTTVFVNGNPIPGADPATFEVILDAYSRDASHIFYFNQNIPEADPATFEILESPYARDSTSVFWMGKVISGSDPSTFKVLNANFECTADANFAYYQDQAIQNFDVSTLPTDVQVNNCSATELYINP